MADANQQEKGLIAWFVYNPVAANLLMLFIFGGGLLSYQLMTKRMMPDIEPNLVTISVVYPGAAPKEVEQAVVIKIEEAVQDIKGIKTTRSTAAENLATVILELNNDVDLGDAVNEIKIQVDAIATFPEEIEKPLISKTEFTADVLWLSVYGDMQQRTRQNLARDIRDEIMLLPQVNKVEILGNTEYEIAIEASPQTLLAYNLSLTDITNAVRQFSRDIPGGSIKGEEGDIRIRTIGQAYSGADFRNLVLKANADGTRLLLGDVAQVTDGFVESSDYAKFNGKPTSLIRIKSVGEENDLELAKAVKEYVKQKQQRLPQEVKLQVWGDGSVYLQQRLDMMFENMLLGIILVFILLTLFLRFSVSFWVLLGIPVCFLGTILFMDKLGGISTNINFLSLFGFIMVLGIVVDDAIIIGESVYSNIQENGHSKKNIILGARRVATPATFGVLTTIAAFAPMLTLESTAAPFFEAIAVVVILSLLFSLIESKLILPAHLAHIRYTPYQQDKANRLQKLQYALRQSMQRYARNKYLPILKSTMAYRYATLLGFIMLLVIVGFIIKFGVIRLEIFPKIANDIVMANFSFNEGSPVEQRDALLTHMQQSIQQVEKQLIEKNHGEPLLRHIVAWTESDVSGGMMLELTRGENRLVNTWDIEKAWRKQVGEVAGVKQMRFISSVGVGGDAAIEFLLVGKDATQLESAAYDFKSRLSEYDGLYDVRTSFSSASKEIKLKLKPQAEALGITLQDLGRQVRQAFYGEEAQRIQRGKDEIKVMVRFPKTERRSVADLQNMYIRSAAGDWTPLSEVAELQMGSDFASIQRQNRKLSVSVQADNDKAKVSSTEITEQIKKTPIPGFEKDYPGLKVELSGQSKESEEFVGELTIASTVALALIYILIAVPLKSYLQPLIVMFVIPFGIIGAVAGHLLFGKDISMMSMFGLIALAGVAVNDSLILVEFVNRARRQGASLMDAVSQAGVQRFRAIVLTSLTTFLGLFPILFETSLQAQIIIPMAISLAFGILFATLVTLVLIPSLYLILEDVKSMTKSLLVKTRKPQTG